MSFAKTFRLALSFFNDSLKEVNKNLGFFSVYIVLLALSTAMPNFLSTYYSNVSVLVQLFAKVVFYIVPLLVLSKIIYVIKIRNTAIGEYKSTFAAYFVYNILFVMLIFTIGVVSLVPFYLAFVLNYPKYLALIAIPADFALIYCGIFYAFVPMVAAIENESPVENYFTRSKNLIKRNIPLIIIYQFFTLLFYIPSILNFVLKNSAFIYPLTIALSIIDALATIILTLVAVKIYFYLSDLE